MEHRIHLIKEATKAKAERMIIKRSLSEKLQQLRLPRIRQMICLSTISIRCKNMRQMDDSLFSGDIGVTVAKRD